MKAKRCPICNGVPQFVYYAIPGSTKDPDGLYILQQKNKRNVLSFPYNGRVYTVDSFCKEFGITKSMFHDRKHKGWNLDEIASTPKNAIGGYRPKGVRVYHG